MSDTFRPETEDQLRDIVAAAVSNKTSLEIVGGGTKRSIGHTGAADLQLDLANLNRIDMYEPDELVMTASAGARLSEIDSRLVQYGQCLAFEPPDWGPLFGQAPGAGTIGGAIAANLGGPRRIRSGAARDHFLGLDAVSGRGEAFHAGGRVMKNVSGYDMCKLLAGSWGTLAVMTRVTFKVLPAGEKLRTVLVMGLDPSSGVKALTDALNSPNDVSAAAYWPRTVAARSGVGYVRDAGASVTAVRVEGPEPSVIARCEALREMFGNLGPVEELHGHNSAAFWKEVGDAAPFAAASTDLAVEPALWRISVPPADGARVLENLTAKIGGEGYLDWGGGLIWLAVPPGAADGAADQIRASFADIGGHATLIRAPDPADVAVPAFQPPAPGVAALNARLREAFDPEGILNPGRMGGGEGRNRDKFDT